MIKRNHNFLEEDVTALNKTDRKIFIFFSFICQFLIVWSVYMLTQIIAKLKGGVTGPWPSRGIDIMSLSLSVSSILMLYGISDSIKRALKT